MKYFYNFYENSFSPYTDKILERLKENKTFYNINFDTLTLYSEEEVIDILNYAINNNKLIQPDGITYKYVDNVLDLSDQINILKAKLSDTDYQAIKYAEGEISEEDYAGIKEQRKKWRSEINVLEEKIASQQ